MPGNAGARLLTRSPLTGGGSGGPLRLRPRLALGDGAASDGPDSTRIRPTIAVLSPVAD